MTKAKKGNKKEAEKTEIINGEHKKIFDENGKLKSPPQNAKVENKESSKKSKKSEKKVIIQNSKVTADIFLEKLKPLKVEIKEDKAHNIGLKINGKTLTYLQRRKNGGFAYQIKKRAGNGSLNWFGSGSVTKEDQMEKLFDGIKEYHKNPNDKLLIKLGFLDKDAIKKA